MTNQQLTTPPDWRGLCEKLVDITTAHANPDDYAVGDVAATLTRARAALAQPEPEVVGPSDEELASHLISAGVDAMEGEPDGTGRMYWEGWNEQVMAAMHAAIAADRARWGRPAPAPAGERQAAPVPVAVSERLPGAEDCNVDGMFWWGRGGKWALLNMRAAQVLGYTHWLPFNALPVPSGEVE